MLTFDAGDEHFSFPLRLEDDKKSDQNLFGRHTAAYPKLGPCPLVPVARPRTQRAQMMDLVRSHPEEEKDVYELSLREIVELPAKKWEGEAEAVAVETGRPEKEKRRHKKRSEATSTAKFLLKSIIPMFPAVLRSRKMVSPRKGAKVSPKAAAGSDDESSNREFGAKRSNNGNSNGNSNIGRNRGYDAKLTSQRKEEPLR
ncbi:hypothetical protein HPP92_005367 [Vanilla planifolia]|uniref:Uncharacterized protein n=1 Tax=Vanilla planifolia TaxID=51239 RepID=A0A835RYM2_VANPL|nr:hypothetical protein HPP92_005367 [Vanilla planifolia]